jgi:hypothetical protein
LVALRGWICLCTSWYILWYISFMRFKMIFDEWKSGMNDGLCIK